MEAKIKNKSVIRPRRVPPQKINCIRTCPSSSPCHPASCTTLPPLRHWVFVAGWRQGGHQSICSRVISPGFDDKAGQRAKVRVRLFTRRRNSHNSPVTIQLGQLTSSHVKGSVGRLWGNDCKTKIVQHSARRPLLQVNFYTLQQMVDNLCLFCVLFSVCGRVQGMSFPPVCVWFSLFIVRVQCLFCLFPGILSSLATSFMLEKVTCFVAHVISVLVRFSYFIFFRINYQGW